MASPNKKRDFPRFFEKNKRQDAPG